MISSGFIAGTIYSIFTVPSKAAAIVGVAAGVFNTVNVAQSIGALEGEVTLSSILKVIVSPGDTVDGLRIGSFNIMPAILLSQEGACTVITPSVDTTPLASATVYFTV
jgi:hypothetical protein